MPDNSKKKHEALSLRLKLALFRRYRRAADFIEVLERERVATKAAFYYHLAGDRRPDNPEVLRKYETLLQVPEHWLERGGGETLDELREAVSAITDRDYSNMTLIRIFTAAGISPPAINHGSQITQAHSGNITEIRHIPYLSDNEIGELFSGGKVVGDLSARTWPMAADVAAGPNSFFWRVPTTDFSMMNKASFPSFPPGTRCLIDRDGIVLPGHYVLCRPKAKALWTLRQYRGAVALQEARKFTLYALNEAFEPIRLSSPTEWDFSGLCISFGFDLV